MSTKWPRRVIELKGPRLWITRSKINGLPGFKVNRVSDDKYLFWIAHLAGLSQMVQIGDTGWYNAKLMDQVNDAMIVARRSGRESATIKMRIRCVGIGVGRSP